jgi:hypothetical protein
VRDLEIAIYLSEHGDLTLELLANAQRYAAALSPRRPRSRCTCSAS